MPAAPVVRLDLFGSGARGVDFDPSRSDADFVVGLPEGSRFRDVLGLKDELEALLGRSVDLVTRRVLEEERNHLRRTGILEGRVLVHEG